MKKITFQSLLAILSLSLTLAMGCVEKIDRRPEPGEAPASQAKNDEVKAPGYHEHPAEMSLVPGVYTMGGEGHAAILTLTQGEDGWTGALVKLEESLPEGAYFLQHPDEFPTEELGEIVQEENGMWVLGSLGQVKLGADADGNPLLEVLDMEHPLSKEAPAILIHSPEFQAGNAPE